MAWNRVAGRDEEDESNLWSHHGGPGLVDAGVVVDADSRGDLKEDLVHPDKAMENFETHSLGEAAPPLPPPTHQEAGLAMAKRIIASMIKRR